MYCYQIRSTIPFTSIKMTENSNEVPIQMAKVDINTPPAKDSPKNIINVLNDDCLQLVLLKLKNLDDFWRAAHVCTRFQANAISCFPFKKVKFEHRTDRCRYNDIYIVPFDTAEDFLSLFGPRIKSLHCDFKPSEMNNEANLRMIARYCGQTLDEFRMNGVQRCDLSLRSHYQALKKLNLFNVSFYNFNASLLLPELQSLEIAHVRGPVEWLKNRFPMLQHVQIELEWVTDDIFIEFQNRNPQIQSLHCHDCLQLTSAVWENIGDRLPNIVDLSITEVGSNIAHLSLLRRLRKLKLQQNMHTISSESKAFFLALVRNNQPIEELRIHGVDAELGGILQNLKTIELLRIDSTPEDIVFDLVSHLPALKYLHVHDFGQWFRLLTVKKIIKNCNKMRKIDIFCNLSFNGRTDLTECDAIVALAKGRVELSLEYIPHYERELTTFDKNMLERNFRDRSNEWIRIRRRF